MVKDLFTLQDITRTLNLNHLLKLEKLWSSSKTCH